MELARQLERFSQFLPCKLGVSLVPGRATGRHHFFELVREPLLRRVEHFASSLHGERDLPAAQPKGNKWPKVQPFAKGEGPERGTP